MPGQPGSQGVGQRGFADGAAENADRGDADLMVDRKLDGSWCSESAASAPGCRRLRQILEPRPCARKRLLNFGHGEDAIDQDEYDEEICPCETALRSDRACGFGIEKRPIVAGAAQRAARPR